MGRQGKPEETSPIGGRVLGAGEAKQRPAASRWALGALGAAAFSAIVLGSAEAGAQQQTFYLDRLYMAGSPDDGIALWRPQMAPKTRFYGQLGMGFALNPFRIEHHVKDEATAGELSAESGAPISTQLITYIDAGFEIFDRFGFQVQVPIIAVQTSNPTNIEGEPGLTAASPNTAALMDVRLDARFIVFRTDDRFFKVGVNGMVWIPAGDKFSYSSDTQANGGFMVSGELDFKKLFLVLNTGLHFRPTQTLNDFQTSSEWRWGVGGFVPLRDGQVRIGLSLFGSTGIADGTAFSASNTPVEWQLDGDRKSVV